MPKDAVPPTGVLAPARSSSAARGQLIIDSVLDELVKSAIKNFNSGLDKAADLPLCLP